MYRMKILIAFLAIAMAGCSEPPVDNKSDMPLRKTSKLSETARIISRADIEDIQSLVSGLLDDVQLPPGRLFRFEHVTIDLLPYYNSKIDRLTTPSSEGPERLARRLRKVFDVKKSEGLEKIRRHGTTIEGNRAGMLLCYFLFHELALHLSAHYKINANATGYDDYMQAWRFAASMLKTLDKTGPELIGVRESLIRALAHYVESAPEEIRKVAKPESPSDTYGKIREKFDANPSNRVIAFHTGRALETLKDQSIPTMSKFVETIKEEIASVRKRVKIADPSLKVNTVYEKRTARMTRSGAELPRGIHTIALDPEDRFYFGRMGTIAALRPGGETATIIEGRQSRFNPICFASPVPGSIVFFEPERRVALDLLKKKFDIGQMNFSGAGGGGKAPGFPIVIDKTGVTYVDVGGEVLKIGADGQITKKFKAAGRTGGLTLSAGKLYRTNTSHHTVEVLDEEASIWAIVAGVKGIAGHRDGRLYSVAFNEPCGIAAATDGKLYVADRCNHSVRLIMPDGTVTTVAGIYRGSRGKNTASAGFSFPCSIVISKNGAIYVAEEDRIRISAIGGASDVPDSKPLDFPGMDHSDARIRDHSREIRDLPFTRDLYTAFISRAQAFSALKEFDKAIADLNQAIELEPDLTQAYLLLTKVHLKRKSTQDAINIYRKLIERLETLPPATYFANPVYFTTHLELARLQLASGDRKASVKTYQRALDLHRTARRKAIDGLTKQDLGELYLALGVFAVEDGDYSIGVRYLTDASKHLMKNAKVFGYRGKAYISLGNRKKAFEDLRQARLFNARYALPHLTLGRFYDKRKEYDVAIYHYRRFIALGGKAAGLEKRIGEIEENLKERVGVGKPYTERIEEDEQARIWRIRKYSDGTEERILIDK
ncbi:MAG: hypothetical protein ACYS8W_00375 [Planctomycetota bacterium]|jgi:tetratricopeptide (TPR) repeat protein